MGSSAAHFLKLKDWLLRPKSNKEVVAFFAGAWSDIAVFLFMFLAIIPLPMHVPADDWDSGSQASYDFWTAHRMQYGVDFVQNVGPYGFIDFPDLYDGFLVVEKLIATIVLTAALVALVIFVSKHLAPKATKWFFYLAVVMFSPASRINPIYITADAQLYLLTLLIACALYVIESRFWIAVLLAILGLLSLSKGTFLFLALPIVAFAFIHHAIHRRRGTAAMVPAIYGASVISFWVLSGQQFTNIPAFLEATIQFVRGYNEAMILNYYRSNLPNLLGAFTFLYLIFGMALSVVPSIRSLPKTSLISRLGLTLVELFLLLVLWKHGFARSEPCHNILAYQFLTIAAVPLLFFPSQVQASSTNLFKKISVPVIAWSLLCWLCLIEVNFFQFPAAPDSLLKKTISRITDNVHMCFDLPNHMKGLDAKLQQSIANMQLPRINAITGNKQACYWGMHAAPMLYNRFSYLTMPATISFAACNQWIMEKDAAFFHDDATSPQYLLYTIEKSDLGMHFVPQDDALAQLEIFQHYDPLLIEKGRILLKRRNAPSATLESIGTTKTYPLTTWIDVPADTPDPLRVVIHLRSDGPSAVFEMLFKTLFRSPIYAIEYKGSDGSIHQAPFVPTMAESGFLIAPLISSNEELLAAYSPDEYRAYRSNKSKTLGRVLAFRIICLGNHFAAQEMSVSFQVVHGLEFGRIDREIK